LRRKKRRYITTGEWKATTQVTDLSPGSQGVKKRIVQVYDRIEKGRLGPNQLGVIVTTMTFNWESGKFIGAWGKKKKKGMGQKQNIVIRQIRRQKWGGHNKAQETKWRGGTKK